MTRLKRLCPRRAARGTPFFGNGPGYMLVKHMTRATLLGVFGLMASLAVSGWPQDGTGSITGTVHDPSGAPVPDAQITVRNRETGIKRLTKTSGNGDYTV